MNTQELYNYRSEQILKAYNHEEGDYVPTLADIGTFAVGLAGSSIQEMESDPKIEADIYAALGKDLNTDAFFVAGCSFGARMAEILGSPAHFVSSDGQTIQHHECSPMTEDDYDGLIADPEAYMFNVLVPRTAKNLAQPYPGNKQVILDYLDHLGGKLAAGGEIVERFKNEYGSLAFATGRFNYPAMDILFDYLRGFQGISVDMRRRPDRLLAAIDALDDFASRFQGVTEGMQVSPLPPYCTMAHVCTFLSPKQFMKFYAPTYMKMLKRVDAAGGKCCVILEGTWANKADFLNDVPKNLLFGMVDQDDIYEMKKLVGENIGLVGGMIFGEARFASLEQNIETAKHAIDELSGGGGYMFGTTKELLSRNDVNWETYCKTYDFVHEYSSKR